MHIHDNDVPRSKADNSSEVCPHGVAVGAAGEGGHHLRPGRLAGRGPRGFAEGTDFSGTQANGRHHRLLVGVVPLPVLAGVVVLAGISRSAAGLNDLDLTQRGEILERILSLFVWSELQAGAVVPLLEQSRLNWENEVGLNSEVEMGIGSSLIQDDDNDKPYSTFLLLLL